MSRIGDELRVRGPGRLFRNPIEAAREVAVHTVHIARLEIELKLVTLRKRAMRFGIGAGLGVAALLLTPILVACLLAAAGAALATIVAVWLAILIVGAALAIVVGVLAGAAFVLTTRAVKRGADGDG